MQYLPTECDSKTLLIFQKKVLITVLYITTDINE